MTPQEHPVQELQPGFFVGIGAARAGTTWLYDWLSRHDDIYLPPVKEVHYFDNAYRAKASIPQSKQVAAQIKKTFLSARLQQRLLDLSFKNDRLRRFLLLSQPNPRWYHDLFLPRNGQHAFGEITPAYSVLQEQAVQALAQVAPHAKVIFIMRDPVARIWSHIRYQTRSRVEALEMADGPIDEFFLARTRYGRTIELYEQFFPAEQIVTGFYEDLVTDPAVFLDMICNKLGVRPIGREHAAELARPVNATDPARCPDHLRDRIVWEFGDLRPYLQAKVGRVPASWSV